LSFDLAKALRRIKPQRAAEAIRRRALEALPFVESPIAAGAELLLDTCVYIDVLQGRTPLSVDELLQARIINHSTICLGELTHLFGSTQPIPAPGACCARSDTRSNTCPIIVSRLRRKRRWAKPACWRVSCRASWALNAPNGRSC
jgi:hypothetical protein